MDIKKLESIASKICNSSADMEKESNELSDQLGLDRNVMSFDDPKAIEFAFTDNAAELELENYLNGFNKCEISIIHAVMYYGRADGSELHTLFNQFAGETKEEMIRTILEKSPRCKYLRDGIFKIKSEGINISDLCDDTATE